jgi:hypothetical protein
LPGFFVSGDDEQDALTRAELQIRQRLREQDL